MFDIDTFRRVSSGLVEVKQCRSNYLYFGSNARITCGNDVKNTNDTQCFEVVWAEEGTSNNDMMVIEGHIATVGTGRYFNATRSNSEAGETVQRASGEPNAPVYFRFIEDKGFIVGSSFNETLVGVQDIEKKCNDVYQSSSVKMEWRYANSYMNSDIYHFHFDYYEDTNVSACMKYVACDNA